MPTQKVTGHTAPTTPPSSPLDTLKALALRNIEKLDYVIDQLAGGPAEVPEELLDFIDGIKQTQFEALAEHVPVARDNRLDELRHVHPDGLEYDDGTPVYEVFDSEHGSTTYFPRYDGDRGERLQLHHDWVRRMQQHAGIDWRFGEIIDGIDWGSNGPPADL